jgi:hypothetical protein
MITPDEIHEDRPHHTLENYFFPKNSYVPCAYGTNNDDPILELFFLCGGDCLSSQSRKSLKL